jgi:hypothetical protein
MKTFELDSSLNTRTYLTSKRKWKASEAAVIAPVMGNWFTAATKKKKPTLKKSAATKKKKRTTKAVLAAAAATAANTKPLTSYFGQGKIRFGQCACAG